MVTAVGVIPCVISMHAGHFLTRKRKYHDWVISLILRRNIIGVGGLLTLMIVHSHACTVHIISPTDTKTIRSMYASTIEEAELASKGAPA